MKLYMNPGSMTSRPVLLLIAERDLPVSLQLVDLSTGEHTRPPYSDMNPNKLVPLLEEGNFRLTESSAILKYLADRFQLQDLYPTDLQRRAQVNERMDWFNTNFYRDFGYGLCYPQIFPHHKRPTEVLQQGTLAWAQGRSRFWLTVLDKHIIGHHAYVCGDHVSLADYFGVCLLTLGEVLRLDFSPYPNVQRWVGHMKLLPHWGEVNEGLYALRQSMKDRTFVGLQSAAPVS